MAKLKDGYLKYITANTPGSDSYVLLAGGGNLGYSNSSVANSLVQRDAYGYIVNNYFYTSTGGAERNASGLGYIAGFNSSDYYIRSYTSAAVKTWLGLGTNAYSSTSYLPLTGGTINGTLGFENITTGTRGLNSTIADNDGWYIQGEGSGNNNGALRIGTWDDGNEPIMVSQGYANTSFARTAYLLDSSGNTSFPGNVTAPSFTGSLSGNATASTKLYTDGSTSGSLMTFNWSGQGGQPTWLWGGTDPTNMYVYNPSNFSVNYASTSGSTSTLSYGGLQTMDTSGTLSQGTKFYGVYNNGYPTMYGNVLNIAGQGYGQLLIGWSGTTGAHADNYIRSLRDSAKGTNGWSDWAKILTSANYGSYAVPLSGGTITGSLTVSSTLTANSGIELYGATPYIDFHFNNSASDYTSRIIESTSGTLTTTGAFKVNGATTLSSTLGVTGLATLGGGLLVSSGGININNSGVWWKDSTGANVYTNITANSTDAGWQIESPLEMWFGVRGGNRFMSFKPYSGEYYVTIGNGTTLTNNGHKLQVNGDIYASSSITTAKGPIVVLALSVDLNITYQSSYTISYSNRLGGILTIDVSEGAASIVFTSDSTHPYTIIPTNCIPIVTVTGGPDEYADAVTCKVNKSGSTYTYLFQPHYVDTFTFSLLYPMV